MKALGALSEDYLYTGISGVDDKEKMIQGHPPGGVGILYKKSLAGSITHIKSTNRRICGINLCIDHLSIIILSIYMPCDKQCLSVNSEYDLCIDYIEQLLNMPECNYFIGAGDYNTFFSRINAQTQCVCDFMDRNKLAVTWDHTIANKEDTYCNFALNQFSCIDHFIVSDNVFNSLCSHDVLRDVINPSSHSLISLSFDFKANHSRMMPNNISNEKGSCCWDRAIKESRY